MVIKIDCRVGNGDFKLGIIQIAACNHYFQPRIYLDGHRWYNRRCQKKFRLMCVNSVDKSRVSAFIE